MGSSDTPRKKHDSYSSEEKNKKFISSVKETGTPSAAEKITPSVTSSIHPDLEENLRSCAISLASLNPDCADITSAKKNTVTDTNSTSFTNADAANPAQTITSTSVFAASDKKTTHSFEANTSASASDTAEPKSSTDDITQADMVTSDSLTNDDRATEETKDNSPATDSFDQKTTTASSDNVAISHAITEDNSSHTTADEEKDEEEEDTTGQPLTLRAHLIELRKRVFWMFLWAVIGFACAYPFATKIFEFMQLPLINALPEGSTFIYTNPSEAFFTEMKVAFVAGIFLTSPMIFFQIWRFIAPGLYEEEKIFLIPLAIFSAFFFISGASFCYFIALPFVFKFFMSYSTGFISAMPSLKESLSFVLQLLLAFGAIFELPLFVFFLARLGIVTADMMRTFRRYAIVCIFIVAAVLTPPDIFSQTLMAGPMLILYELSIYVAVIFGKKTVNEVDAAENNDT